VIRAKDADSCSNFGENTICPIGGPEGAGAMTIGDEHLAVLTPSGQVNIFNTIPF